MDIDERIQRRQRQTDTPRLVQDYDALSPVAHVDEPTGRGPMLERLLDHLDPAFDGRLPPNGYLFGPFGAGKSAVVVALFGHLETLSHDSQSVIYTSTRKAVSRTPRFVYVDLRMNTSEFAFYHSVLNGLVSEPVPEHGVSTAQLQDRIHEVLRQEPSGAVVAVDHVDEAEGVSAEALIGQFGSLPSNVSWLAVGRAEPAHTPLTEFTAPPIAIERYRQQTLVDVVMNRAGQGLSPQAVTHDVARQLTAVADGNAHNALAALFVAVERARESGRDQLLNEDVEAAAAELPEPAVSLGRVFALTSNKQAVLRHLVDIPQLKRNSVTDTTEAISASMKDGLSPGTIKRFLYEMADIGVVERVQSTETEGKGRPPSRVEVRFSPTVFRRLYDLRNGDGGL